MKRRIEYILTEDEIKCIGYIRTAKEDLERMSDKICREDSDNAKYADFMYDIVTKLSWALNKLEIE